MDYSKRTHFWWQMKWRLEHLGTLGIMGGMAPLTIATPKVCSNRGIHTTPTPNSHLLRQRSVTYFHLFFFGSYTSMDDKVKGGENSPPAVLPPITYSRHSFTATAAAALGVFIAVTSVQWFASASYFSTLARTPSISLDPPTAYKCPPIAVSPTFALLKCISASLIHFSVTGL